MYSKCCGRYYMEEKGTIFGQKWKPPPTKPLASIIKQKPYITGEVIFFTLSPSNCRVRGEALTIEAVIIWLFTGIIKYPRGNERHIRSTGRMMTSRRNKSTLREKSAPVTLSIPQITHELLCV
jgi:hypothetical protein